MLHESLQISMNEARCRFKQAAQVDTLHENLFGPLPTVRANMLRWLCVQLTLYNSQEQRATGSAGLPMPKPP